MKKISNAETTSVKKSKFRWVLYARKLRDKRY